MKKNSLVLLVLVFIAAAGFSQDKNEETLLRELDKANSAAKKIEVLKDLGALTSKVNPERSVSYAEKCLVLSLKTGNKDGEANSYNSIGSYYFTTGNYLKATDNYLKSLRIYSALENKRMLAVVHNNLGTLNMKQGNLQEARIHLNKAISLKQELKRTKGLANCYQSLASVYYLEQDYDEAAYYFKKGAEIAGKRGEQHVEMACLNGFASVEFKNGRYRESLNGYKEALSVLKKIEGDNRKPLSGLYHNMAEAYTKIGEYDKAIKLLNESLRIAKEIRSNEDIKQAYSGLSATYKEKGDLGNALINQEYASVYKDSVINENTLKSINELQEKYKSEEHKKEISELKEKNDDLEVRSTLQYSLLIVSAGAIVLIILVVFFYLKQVRAGQQKKHAELEQKALRAQMNPHFIFNSLNSIQRMYIEGKEDIANDYMADFSRLLRNILENSGKSLIRLKEELDVIRLYMNLEMIRTDYSFDYSCEIADDIDQLLIKIPPLIFQPYLENAIWHGVISKKEKGAIRLVIRKAQPGQLICEVIDNGVGFFSGKKIKAATDNESRGMQITAERLGGQENVVIEELNTGGTKINLTIHYTE